MRTNIALVVVAALAACGDNLHPESDQLTAVSDEADPSDDDDGGGDDEPAPRAILVNFTTDPNECTDNSVRLMASVHYADDGSLIEDPICHYQFSDGREAFGCFAVISAPEPLGVVLTARDPATGAIGRDEDTVEGPDSFETTAEITSSGLTISWSALNNYGGVLNVGGVNVSVDPFDKVVARESTGDFSGTITVSEAGTYTVTVNGFITFGENGGCGSFVTKTLDLTCEDDSHTK